MNRPAPWLPALAVGIGLFGLRDAWTALLLYHLGIVLFLVSGRQGRLLPLLLRGRSAYAVPAGLVCLAGGLSLAALWPWLGAEPGGLAADLARLGLAGGRRTAFLVYYVAVNPLLEELFWRGWLAPATGRPHWHDLAFAFYHGLVLVFFIDPPWILLCLAILAIASWTWRRMARAWGGLVVPAVSHLAADVGIILAIDFLVGA